jgi:hypothetical protein
MARVQADLQQFTFAGGLFTDASQVNYPESTAQVLENFELRRDGSARRRLGVQYEENYSAISDSITAADVNSAGVSTFLWRNAAGQADADFAVVQINDTLYFFDASDSEWSSTAINTLNAPSLDLSTYTLAGVTTVRDLAFDSGYGTLFVVGPDIEPFYVTYDPAASTGVNPFSGTQINIRVRDFDGIDDGTANDNRPISLTNSHEYNLRNAGWPEEFSCFTIENGDAAPTVTDPIAWTNTSVSFYPSRADIIHFAKSTAAIFSTSVGSYSPWFLQKINVGNTESPKGRFILGAFNRNRSSVSGITGLTTVTYDSRPSAVAFFAGRVFYAGMEDSDLVGTLYFSQILTSIDNVGECYQDQDPTAEQLNSLLATDGGAIEIPDAGKIYKLVPFDRSLVVIADNGVWQIIGSEETGFTASSFAIRYVTSVGGLSARGVTQLNEGIAYVGESGLYVLQDNELGIFSVSSITDNVISEYFQSFSKSSKRTAKAFFDTKSNKLLWLFKSTTADHVYKSNTVLLYDINLQAFYTYVISDTTSTPFIVDVLQNSSDNTEQLAIKLLTFIPDGTDYEFTFSEFLDRDFVDWGDAEFTSTLITGYILGGEAARTKQIRFWIPHFERTETALADTETGYDFPSGCTARVRFDFTSNITAGRWSQRFKPYRLNETYLSDVTFDYGYDVISTKNRVRGSGRAMQFEITSEAGKDIRLLGWDISITGRSRV